VIRRLGELHADGHISADDFEVKKAELLARLKATSEPKCLPGGRR
jgi:hypothetical protein